MHHLEANVLKQAKDGVDSNEFDTRELCLTGRASYRILIELNDVGGTFSRTGIILFSLGMRQ